MAWDEELLGRCVSSSKQLAQRYAESGLEPLSAAQPQVSRREWGPTCIAHEVVVRSVEETVKATGVVSWPWVTTELVFWGWVGVTAEVSSLKRGLRLHAGVTARLDF